MTTPRGGVRVAAGIVGALGGAALTPVVVRLLPEPECADTIAAACAARQPTVWSLLLCAAVGAALLAGVATLATRGRSPAGRDVR